MAVCTGTASYLAVNRQANAASAPSSPTNVSLSAGNASITVSWHSPISLGGGSLTNYIIEHRTLGAGSWATNNAAPTATSHTISGLTNDQKYQVRIAAKTASGTSPYTPILFAIPHAAPTISQVNPAADVTPGQTITIQGSGFLPKEKTIVQVGDRVALASDGTVYSWGENAHGQLGNGTTINYTVPVATSTTGNSALAPSVPKVTIGGVPATDITIVDSNTITMKVPAYANGLVDLVMATRSTKSLKQMPSVMVLAPPRQAAAALVAQMAATASVTAAPAQAVLLPTPAITCMAGRNYYIFMGIRAFLGVVWRS